MNLQGSHMTDFSSDFEKSFGGFKYIKVTHDSMRAWNYLKGLADAILFLQNLGWRAREQQEACHVKAFRWLTRKSDRAMREIEGKETAFKALSSLGARALKQSNVAFERNYGILYEWGSYALYRDRVYGELSEGAQRALEQWGFRDKEQIGIERMAQKALHHQLTTQEEARVKLEEEGNMRLAVYLEKWMKLHEAHKWLIEIGLKHWRIQMRHDAMRKEAAEWLESIATQAIGREMLKRREDVRRRAREKARERGLLHIKSLNELESKTMGEILGIWADRGNQADTERAKHRNRRKFKGKDKSRRREGPGVDEDIFEKEMVAGHTWDGSRMPAGGTKEDVEKDSVDILVSGSAAEALIRKTRMMKGGKMNKDVGRNVDQWSGNAFIGHYKVNIPGELEGRTGAGLKKAKEAYLREVRSLRSSGNLWEKLPYEVSLKSRAKALAQSGMEAISPQHKLDVGEVHERRDSNPRPLSPSDFFRGDTRGP